MPTAAAALVGLAVVAGLIVGATACAAPATDTLGVNLVGGGGQGFELVRQGTPRTAMFPSLCVNGSGPVTIEDVTAFRPTGGMRVVSWADHSYDTRSPQPSELPGAPPGLATQVLGYGHYPVTERCGSPSDFSDLYVSGVGGSANSTMQGITIIYRTRDGVTGRVDAGWSLQLCTRWCPGDAPRTTDP